MIWNGKHVVSNCVLVIIVELIFCFFNGGLKSFLGLDYNTYKRIVELRKILQSKDNKRALLKFKEWKIYTFIISSSNLWWFVDGKYYMITSYFTKLLNFIFISDSSFTRAQFLN